MNRIGIVGHEAAKFTPDTEIIARRIIRRIIRAEEALPVIVSGRCPLGGIDVWAEEIAEDFGCDTLIFPPKVNRWEGGYKQRNIDIAKNSDAMHVIVVQRLPESYTGMRFSSCYHCHTDDHVKSGGCWTAWYWQRLSKKNKAMWHVIGERYA